VSTVRCLLKESIEDLSGVKSANASYATQYLDVEFDDTQVTIDEIVVAVAKEGYTAIATSI
jgi:copper chaperone CopZ